MVKQPSSCLNSYLFLCTEQNEIPFETCWVIVWPNLKLKNGNLSFGYKIYVVCVTRVLEHL